jgi:hypothetical protein
MNIGKGHLQLWGCVPNVNLSDIRNFVLGAFSAVNEIIEAPVKAGK